jgi:dihydroflavonol-4-reductase
MKIFITGASGFIGSTLIKRLTQTKHKLYCLVRKTGKEYNLGDNKATLVAGDVTDKSSILNGMKGCDWVIHMASSFEFWIPDIKVYKQVNVNGTRNVMESALESGVSKIVNVSTAAVYGNAKWPITEESIPGLEIKSKYAKTKYEGDLLAWELFRQKDLPLVVIYPGAVIGANDLKATGRYIKRLALGKMPAQILVNVKFPFVYVEDVCDAILKALEKENNIGEKYLITKYSLTFGEFNQMINDISGVRLPRLSLPHFMSTLGSIIATGLSTITRKSPILDLSIDQIKLMKQGFICDGSKAERELGLIYTPIPLALKEAIESYKKLIE